MKSSLQVAVAISFGSIAYLAGQSLEVTNARAAQPVMTASPSLGPVLSPSPSTYPVPSIPSPPSSPTASPTPDARNAIGQILSVDVYPRYLRPGMRVRAVVTTTPEIVSVRAIPGRLQSRAITIPNTGPGHFEGEIMVPPLPFYIRGDVEVTFVGQDATGMSTQKAITVRVR